MPFFPNFKEVFESGDLLYGLSPQRNFYADNCKEFKWIDDAIVPISIDQYYPSQRIMDMFIKKGKTIIGNQDEFINFLKNHPKYTSASSVSPYQFADSRSIIVLDPQSVYRKCKAGLAWAAQTNARFSIHFLLDSIDMDQLVLKTHPNDHEHATVANYLHEHTSSKNIKLLPDNFYPNQPVKCKATTGSELRWIYRNRRDPNVQQAIQFWCNFKPCYPPWDPRFNKSIAQKWIKYVPKTT